MSKLHRLHADRSIVPLQDTCDARFIERETKTQLVDDFYLISRIWQMYSISISFPHQAQPQSGVNRSEHHRSSITLSVLSNKITLSSCRRYYYNCNIFNQA